jgi:PIN domain nuclease of toxin-antitoxin system
LLDTSIVIPLVEERTSLLPRDASEALKSTGNTLHVSVASLWEIAIKSRLGKLPLKNPLSRLPDVLFLAGIDIISIRVPHVIAELDPIPSTRDPFDRMLLTQCQVEGMRLVTRDKALAVHPLAWRPD